MGTGMRLYLSCSPLSWWRAVKQAKLAPPEGAAASRFWANLLTASNHLCGRHDWGIKVAGGYKWREETETQRGGWTLEKKPEACCTDLVLKEWGLQSQKVLGLSLGFITYELDDQDKGFNLCESQFPPLLNGDHRRHTS